MSSPASPALSPAPDPDGEGWSPALLDPARSPGEDFYEHAVGLWRGRHPIPEDRARWGTFDELHRRNSLRIVRLLDEAADLSDAPDPLLPALGRFFRRGFDETRLARRGLEGLAPLRAELGAVRTADELFPVLARLHRSGVDGLFYFGPQIHPRESDRHIASLWQSGLGLPDREHYLREEVPYPAIRAAYLRYLAGLLAATGARPAGRAEDGAEAVLALETALARASVPREVLRDPERTFHPVTPEELARLWGSRRWRDYLDERGLGTLPSPVNVAQPGYVRTLAAILGEEDPARLALYLETRLLDAFAPFADEALAHERFAFTRVLTGQPRLRPRAERVASAVEGAAGFVLGRFYCARYVPPEDKARVVALFDALRRTLDERLARLPWLSPAARAEAREKLRRMRARLAYPDRWRDDSALRFADDDFLANILEGARHETAHETAKIGRPVDPDEWEITPQTVNAFYSPPRNEIVFPAGILDRPFFDPDAPDAYNYGALGAVIGHEMLHGFDDQGRKYDARGNLRDWWSEEDGRHFAGATGHVREALAALVLDGGLRLNPDLVLGEALADLGGLDLAHEAWRRFGNPAEGRGRFAGVPPERLFFYAFAFLWAGDTRPDALRLQIDTDPHPPLSVRVNFTTARLPAFRAAFGLPEGGGPEPFTLWSGG